MGEEDDTPKKAFKRSKIQIRRFTCVENRTPKIGIEGRAFGCLMVEHACLMKQVCGFTLFPTFLCVYVRAKQE